MKIHKSFKFRIYPTKEQEVKLAQHFGSCRFVWNYFLNRRKESYLNENKSLTYCDCSRELTQLKNKEEYNWLYETGAHTLQQSLRDLDVAYNSFFRKERKFPNFKSRSKSKQSFRIVDGFRIENNKLHILKFKEGIKINLHRSIEGEICYITVLKTRTNKYFASFCCEVESSSFPKTDSQIGIDTGIKKLATLSDGTTYDNIKSLKQLEKKLKYNQRQLAKKKKGSNNREKQRIKLARIYETITNVRKDHLHKVSTTIVKSHDVICVEDLNVVGMMKNHCVAKALSDVALGMFYRQLEYKCAWNDRKFIKIDRYFPSSKTCSNCSWVVGELPLSIREWDCPNCGAHLDRDINAAQNILKQGLNILSASSIESDSKQKQGEALSLDKSMNLDQPQG